MKTLLKTSTLLLVLLLSACATTEKRIQANAELFSTFSAEDQALIRENKIAIGFTPQMVEIAKGKPQYVNLRTSLNQEVTIWRYTYLREYSSTQPVYGSDRYRGIDWVNVSESQEKEYLRVEFVGGKVLSFEEVLP